MSTADRTDHVPAQAGRQLELIHRVARVAAQPLLLRMKLRQVVDALKRHLGCELVACVSIDAQLGRFVCEAFSSELPTEVHVGYCREIGSGVIGEVAATGRTLCVGDVTRHANYVEILPGARSELCVAVHHNGDVIAVLNVECTRLDAFGNDVELVETVAVQVAGIIAAARLNDEQRRRTILLTMMSDLARIAIEAGDLDQTLRRIVQFLRSRFALEISSVLLFDDARERLVLRAHAGRSTFSRRLGEDWPSGEGVVGRAQRSGEMEFVPDVACDPDYVAGNSSVRAELVVPIRFHGVLLGLLNLESREVEAFSEENRQMITALAGQVAGAIHLAATNERLRETNRLVEEKSAALGQANMRLREVNARLERLLHLDGLTGIANRRGFDEALSAEWQLAQRLDLPLSLLLLDIDDFKAYNDGYGHLAGDDALRRVAIALAGALQRDEDLLARYGGEEFAVLLPGRTAAEAEQCAWRLHAAVAALGLPHRYARAVKRLSVSIGIASLDAGVLDAPEHLLDRADRALYRAKALGRNRVESEAELPPAASSA